MNIRQARKIRNRRSGPTHTWRSAKRKILSYFIRWYHKTGGTDA